MPYVLSSAFVHGHYIHVTCAIWWKTSYPRTDVSTCIPYGTRTHFRRLRRTVRKPTNLIHFKWTFDVDRTTPYFKTRNALIGDGSSGRSDVEGRMIAASSTQWQMNLVYGRKLHGALSSRPGFIRDLLQKTAVLLFQSFYLLWSTLV